MKKNTNIPRGASQLQKGPVVEQKNDSESQQKRTKKILFMIVFIFFVFVDGFVIGMLFVQRTAFRGQRDVSPDFVENVNTSNDAASKETNVNTDSATQDQGTPYTSKGLGMNFTLFSPFVVSGSFDSDKDDFFQADTYTPSQKKDASDEIKIGLKLEIYLLDNPKELSLLEWSVENGSGGDSTSVTFLNTTVNKKKALEQEIITLSDAIHTYYIVSDATHVCAIYFSGDRDSYTNTKQQKVMKSIMDSITFIKK